MQAMETLTVPLIFDFIQRKFKPRQDAFDYFLGIKNSALLLAFVSQEIKQIKEIKRASASRIQTAALKERDVNLINNQAGENQVSVGILDFFQVGNQDIK